MLDIFAPDPVAEQLKQAAREFLFALRDGRYDHIWHNLITLEAAQLLSTALWPIHAYESNEIETLFDPIAEGDLSTVNIAEGLSLAFQIDIEGIRSDFFDGLANGVEETGWYDFSDQDCYVFVDRGMAVLLAETPGIPLMMPFVLIPGESYKVDFEAWAIFSMRVSASLLYRIGVKALEIGRQDSALTYFELAATLSQPHYRLRRLVLEHPVSQNVITDERKREYRKKKATLY